MTSQITTPSVIVVGGGVIGLSIAWRLSGSGSRVTVIERDVSGRGASWAAGGMLSPLAEAEESGPFLAMAAASHQEWPDWAARLEAQSGAEIGLHLNGKTLVAFDQDEAARLRERFDWQSAAGHDVRWLNGEDVFSVEPSVATHVVAGMHLPHDGRVNNRGLVAALREACSRRGVRIREGVEVTKLATSEGQVVGVETVVGPARADLTIVAAGAWTPELVGETARPVKGQMVELAPEGRPVNGVIAAPGAYLIPRDTPYGHRIVVGATMEDAGFDLSTSEAAIQELQSAAIRAVPSLASAERTDAWAGLRPGSPDDLPILGPDPLRPGLIHAHGHHRNGVLLAPITAIWVESWVLGVEPPGAGAFLPR